MEIICIEIVCPLCGTVSHIFCCEEDYLAFLNGDSVQNALWYLAPSERELLLSGLCEKCQQAFFYDDVELGLFD